MDECDLEQRLARAPLVVEPREERACAAIVVDSLGGRPQRPRVVAGDDQRVGRLARHVGFGQVPGKHRRRRGRPGLGRQLLERFGDTAVGIATVVLQHARIRDLLHQAVAEPVLRRGPAPLLGDQVEPLELEHRGVGLLGADQLLQKLHPKRATDGGAQRGHLAGRRGEASQPRLKGGLNGDRHRHVVPLDAQLEAVLAHCEHVALDQIADGFLDEERVAARPLGDQL